MMEQTLVLIKPGTIQRGLAGEVITRFERKGLRLVGMKMIWLNDAVLDSHYAHLKEKPFFAKTKESMCTCPVIACCWEGVEAIRVVRAMAGPTNGRDAAPGTIRGDYAMSVQENIIHASDSPQTAREEIDRFFAKDELFRYPINNQCSVYAQSEA